MFTLRQLLLSGVQRASACGVIRGSRRDHGTSTSDRVLRARASSFLRGVSPSCVRRTSASGEVRCASASGRVHRAVSIAPVAEPIAMSFTVPLRHHRLPLHAVVTTCSVQADCSDSATAMCSGGVCVAMSCGGERFTPDGAFDSLWDSVKPMTGKYQQLTSSSKRTSGAYAC